MNRGIDGGGTEFWFVIEASYKGRGDWYRIETLTYDTLNAAIKRYEEIPTSKDYEYRVMKVTATSVPVYHLR
jgi:hypothetical protein